MLSDAPVIPLDDDPVEDLDGKGGLLLELIGDCSSDTWLEVPRYKGGSGTLLRLGGGGGTAPILRLLPGLSGSRGGSDRLGDDMEAAVGLITIEPSSATLLATGGVNWVVDSPVLSFL